MASPRHLITIEDLPGEVLSDIFIRLLAKQLAQMRCVSKSWNALLSDSSFIKSHLHRSINKKVETLLFFREGLSFECSFFTPRPTCSPDSKLTDLIKLPVKPQPKDTHGRIIGSANGLICFCYRSYSLLHTNCVVYIWNPSLSVVLTLPPCSLPPNDKIGSHFRFGYDPKTDDYKVVKLTTISRAPNMVPQGEVYSMRKGSWKSISQSFPCHVTLIRPRDEVCVNDHVHWICYTDSAFKSLKMVAFDLSVETFREIPLPDSILPHHEYRFVEFGVSGGKLCVMLGVRDGSCEVWVMNEYGVAESWVKHHVFSQFGGDIKPFGFTSHGEFLFYKDHFATYDPVADKVKNLKITMDLRRSITKVVEYVDSLVWVTPADRQISSCSISDTMFLV